MMAPSSRIACAIRRFPQICVDGIFPHPCGSSRPIDPAQVETAIQFLSMLTPTKTARIRSGTLKHHAERWGRRHGLSNYISRGALIVAAVALGLVVRGHGARADNPSVGIGVSIKDLKRINAGEQEQQKGYRR
jgi:hypothetical protein